MQYLAFAGDTSLATPPGSATPVRVPRSVGPALSQTDAPAVPAVAVVATRLDAEVDPAWRPSFVAVGKDATGAWRTGALKEYPPRMCRAIAGACRDSLASADAGRGGDEVVRGAAEELERLVVPLEVGAVGPDFAADAAEALPPGPVQWDQIAAAAGTEPAHLRATLAEAPLRRWKRGSARAAPIGRLMRPRA